MKPITMRPNSALRRHASLVTAAILLSGCTTPVSNPFKAERAEVKAERAVVKSERTEESAAQSALSAGIALYNNGDYSAAAKKLGGAGDIWKADKKIQLEALKYMAFSYCVTSQPVPCRQQFEKALKLDPTFDLEPGEKGHPLWGPVFARAKKQR